MRQQERSERTRRKIMLASMEEFGSHSYAAASVNSICERGDLPKGLIYHYFRSKEELYLACMKEMMDGLIQRLESRLEESTEEGEALLLECFRAREGFFRENPQYAGFFRNAMVESLQPSPLGEKIFLERQRLIRINLAYLNRVIEKMTLCDGLSASEVEEMFLVYQDIVNTKIQRKREGEQKVEEEEALRMRWVRLFLYGIIKR